MSQKIMAHINEAAAHEGGQNAKVSTLKNMNNRGINQKLSGQKLKNGEFLFVRSGNIRVYHGYLGDTGTCGYYWSRSGGSSTPNSYFLSVTRLSIGTSTGPANRYYGFPLRCLQE